MDLTQQHDQNNGGSLSSTIETNTVENIAMLDTNSVENIASIENIAKDLQHALDAAPRARSTFRA